MISLDLSLILTVLSILGILVGAIAAIVKIYYSLTKSISNVDVALIKNTVVLEGLVEKITKLEGYDERIDNNEKAIQQNAHEIDMINQRCELIIKENNNAK